MPPRYTYFTKQEKAELRRQYRANVQTINRYVNGPTNRVPLNMAEFERKINDPKFIRIYKKGLEINQRRRAKDELCSQLVAKFKYLKDPKKIYGGDRVVSSKLILSDDPEAVAYNEAVIKQYLEHPEAVVQERLQKLLNFNPKIIDTYHKNPDFDSLMINACEKDEDLFTDAFNFRGLVNEFKGKNILVPELEERLDSIVGNYEMLVQPLGHIDNIKSNALFTAPALTENLQQEFDATGFMDAHEDIYSKMQEMRSYTDNTREGKIGVDEFFKYVHEHDININEPGGMGKIVGIGTNEYTEQYGYVSPVSVLGKSMKCDDMVVSQLKPNQLHDMAKVFKKDYIAESGYKPIEKPAKFKDIGYEARNNILEEYAIKNRVSFAKLDNDGISSIAESYKGKFKEWFFRTTSRQYKNFKSVLKNFENPSHRDYGKHEPVLNAANEYLIHKGVQSVEQAMALPQPGKDRALLCLSVVTKIQDAVGYENGYIAPGQRERFQGKPQKSDDWPQAIKNPKEVDIDDNTIIIDNDNKIKPEKQKEIVDDETEINTNIIKKDQ